MELLVVVLLVGGAIWFVASIVSHNAIRGSMEQVEVNERNRLALLVLVEMRKWEYFDPARVGINQCIEQGTYWALERRAGMAPALGNMIAKSAYRQILSEKIERRIGFTNFSQFVQHTRAEGRRLQQLGGFADAKGIDKWWDDVDYEFDCLQEKAFQCGALATDFAFEFYGREKPGLPPGNMFAAAQPPFIPPTHNDAPASIPVFTSCAACATANDADATFCKSCGASIAASPDCRKCGTRNDADASFCKKCGEPRRSAAAR